MTDSNNAHTVIQDDVLDFLGFPGEVRNKIYKLVADYIVQRDDSRAHTSLYCEYNWDWKRVKRLVQHGGPEFMILQPGLFLTCRQSRTEGLPFFYQRRKFDLPLSREKHILDLYWYQAGFSAWFQEIGELGQQNIRHLTLRNALTMKSINSIERIHRKLSEKATVMYEAETSIFAAALWKIGTRYHAKNKEKVPVFWNPHSRNNGKISNYEGPPRSDLYGGCRLEFKAGSGWFGMAQDNKAQLWWRRDKRIEKWNQEWLVIDEESRPNLDVERYYKLRRWRRAKWTNTVEEASLVQFRPKIRTPGMSSRYHVDSDSGLSEDYAV